MVLLGTLWLISASYDRYLPEVDGIVLAHSDVKFVTDKGKILYDSPFFHFFVTVKFLVWKPKRGSKLGKRENTIQIERRF